MRSDEFINKLKVKCPNNANDVEAEDIIRWVDVKLKLPEEKIEDMYEYVSHQYKSKTFPSVASLEEIWDRMEGSIISQRRDDDLVKQNARHLIIWEGVWTEYPMDKLLDALKVVRHRLNADALKTRLIEKEFWYRYEDLYAEWMICDDLSLPVSEKMGHLEKVRQACETVAQFVRIKTIRALRERDVNNLTSFITKVGKGA